MNSKIKLALTMLFVAAFASVQADDSAVVQTKGKHVKKYDCLRVNNELRVCGDELIDGVLTLVNQPVFSPALAVGTPGVPGLGGDLAFGAVGFSAGAPLPTPGDQIVAQGDPVTFNIIGPSAGVVPSSSGITVTNAGIYRIQASLTGYADAAVPLTFELRANGTVIPGASFEGPYEASGVQNVVSGVGIIALAEGDALTLVNVTNSTEVTLPVLYGSDTYPVTNVVLTVERIA